MIKFPTMAIVVTGVFYEDNKYYPQFFLEKFLYKI